ncbi:hypothetical protein AB6A40_000357 [Gnathostoma spinigerum]|uniref:Mitochondrial GTPase 1 n=1 Tax=Gnathostoma spinigerum TaxID=75299 RepID=A0ABD6EA91_9BILA
MHMSVQMKKMEGKLRSVDLIVEVHDARIPITGRNSLFFTQLYAIRPHILIFNKMDLINLKKYRKPIEEYYREKGVENILWTDCKTRLSSAIKNVQSTMLECLRNSPRFNRTVKTEYQIMVVGIPNVGKSSLINSLRLRNLGNHKQAVAEGARPGVTVRVQNRVRILDRPPIYVLDTPGILAPYGRQIDDAMKLSICGLILESTINPLYVADYLLYWLNKTGDEIYANQLNVSSGPTDHIQTFLLDVCRANDFRIQCRIPGRGTEERWDIDKAANFFIDSFRKGKFQDQCLDKDLLQPYLVK